MAHIFIGEETGGRYWRWYFPGTKVEFEKWVGQQDHLTQFFEDAGKTIVELSLGKVRVLGEEDYLKFIRRFAGYNYYMHLNQGAQAGHIFCLHQEWKEFFFPRGRLEI